LWTHLIGHYFNFNYPLAFGVTSKVADVRYTLLYCTVNRAVSDNEIGGFGKDVQIAVVP